MAKIQISGHKTILHDESIEANDRVEAYHKMKNDKPDFIITIVGGYEIIGICATSGDPIFNDDSYWSDKEDILHLISKIPKEMWEVPMDNSKYFGEQLHNKL